MQGDELIPGRKNVFRRCARLRAPHVPGRICTLNSLKNLRKTTCGEIGQHFLALLGRLGTMVMVARKCSDNAGAQLMRFGMRQFQRGHLLQRGPSFRVLAHAI